MGWREIGPVVYWLPQKWPLVGCSLILDAHPNIVLADEARFLTVWQTLPNKKKTRDHLFRLLYERSVKLATKGERSSGNCDGTHIGYKYHVPNQWQGHFDKAIQVGQ